MKSISPLARAVTKPTKPMEGLTPDNDSRGTDGARMRELKFGMWLFLSTETLIFGGFFVIYFWNRFHQNAGFTIGSYHMDFWLGAANTLVLLTSSFCMAVAVMMAQRRSRVGVWISLLGVWGLGAAFLGVKAFEYKQHFDEGLFPGFNFTYTGDLTNQVYSFMSLYVLGTGLHAVHMIIGLGLVTFLAARQFFEDDVSDTAELVGLYWHFVDVVWVFLFPAFYLIGSR